jgi:DNA segregation ATPase FtsK/SpoIIIE, S-DNA-T family
MPLPNAQQKANLTPEQLGVVSKLVGKLIELQIDCEFVPPVTVGPVISLYKFRPTGKTRVSNIESLADDFAVTLGVEDVLVKRRVGDSAVSIAVPNATRTFVQFRDTVGVVFKLLQGDPKPKIPLNLGVDEFGTPLIEDLTTLPHLLIAGATNAGKSMLLRCILGTIVYTMNSRAVQLVVSDTKGGVEFGMLDGLPQMAFPRATTTFQTLERMQWITDVVEDRLRIIAGAGKQNIAEYNEIAKVLGGNSMPYIVLIIDEIADLMVNQRGGKSSESKIADELLGKIAYRARAAGAHIIAATQRPSVNVISGSIKANLNARLSFRTNSVTDSRVILDQPGAEHLLVPGDMLYSSPSRSAVIRAHSPLVKNEDVKAAMEFARHRESL